MRVSPVNHEEGAVGSRCRERVVDDNAARTAVEVHAQHILARWRELRTTLLVVVRVHY